MKRKNKPSAEIIARLKKEVENRLTFSLVTPNDFIRLSDTIQDEGFGYISPTTLKRVWGYISDVGTEYVPGSYTLRSLCNLIGFSDIKDFENTDLLSVQSQEYSGTFIESHLIQKDAVVVLRWSPNRICCLKHIDATLFEVIKVRNSHLKVGDKVDCACFTQHAPAYFSRVFRQNKPPKTYIAGSANGITYSILPNLDAVTLLYQSDLSD